jgi:hypothetical protein
VCVCVCSVSVSTDGETDEWMKIFFTQVYFRLFTFEVFRDKNVKGFIRFTLPIQLDSRPGITSLWRIHHYQRHPYSATFPCFSSLTLRCNITTFLLYKNRESDSQFTSLDIAFTPASVVMHSLSDYESPALQT